jgi:hypothetical protein
VRSAPLLFLIAFVASACGSSKPAAVATPSPISSAAISGATLSPTDMGPGWTPKAGATLNTVQIGGRVGATNIANPPAQATTAYTQKVGSGFVTDSVILMGTPTLAGNVIDAHVQAANTTTWTQTRTEGGQTDWKIAGPLNGLASLGEQTFATSLHATITDAQGVRTARTVEYVVFRVGRVVAFVVAQDVGVAPFATKLESKVAQAANGTP